RSWDCYGPSAMLTAPAEAARQIRATQLIAIAALLAGCARPPTPIEQASLLAEKGQDAQAIALLDHFLQEHPRAIAERRLLVRLLGATSDIPRAQKEAGRLAALLPPTSPIPWLEIGHVEELSHRYEEAL